MAGHALGGVSRTFVPKEGALKLELVQGTYCRICPVLVPVLYPMFSVDTRWVWLHEELSHGIPTHTCFFIFV